MPDLGETRTANGETRTWDGSAWKLAPNPPSAAIASGDSRAASIQALKDYASELISGKGTARGEALDFGKKEAGGMISTLNPINQVKGLINAVTTDPRETVKGLVKTGSDALSGDPTAIGNVMGMAVLPRANVAMLRGVNSGATAIADSPSVRSGIGYVGGAGSAVLSGAGHPFIGAAIGRMVSPLLKAPAQEVANVSGSVLNKLADLTGESAAPEMSVGEKLGLPKPSGTFESPLDLTRRLKAESVSSAKPSSPMSSADPGMSLRDQGLAAMREGFERAKADNSAQTPKPAFSAADVLKIQSLVKQGVPQSLAVKILDQAKQGGTLASQMLKEAERRGQ